MEQSQLNALDKNILIPFFPSGSWELKIANVVSDNTKIPASTLPYFNYIQAFFPTETSTAILAIFAGKYHANGTPIVSPVRFAYSGERVNIKGQLILTTGTDILGYTVTSTTIGSDITNVYAYGGTQ